MSVDTILNGIVPVFLLIALGYGLKKSGFLPLPVWPPIEKFAVYLLYPGFLIPAIWHANLTGFSAGPVSLGVLGSVVVASVIGFALKPVLRPTSAAAAATSARKFSSACLTCWSSRNRVSF